MTEEQKKDKTYLKKFLKSSSIQDQIAGFKQKLEDARSNLTVRTLFYFKFSITVCSLSVQGELTLRFQLKTAVTLQMEVQRGFERLATSSTVSVNELDLHLTKYARDVSKNLFDVYPEVNNCVSSQLFDKVTFVSPAP